MTLFPTRQPDADRPGLVRHDASESSRKAALAVWPTTGTKRAAVLAAIAEAGERGMTDQEIEAASGIRADTSRARRVELARDGWIEDSGRTRPTDTGCEAAVWIASGPGRMELARQTEERA